MEDLDFILGQLGENHQEYYGSMAPPLIQTSNFAFNCVADLRKAITNERESLIYSRGNNPTINILEKKIAALEHCEASLIFASGMAAISAAVLSCVKTGDHVICIKQSYSWTNTLFNSYLQKFNITTTFIDGADIQNVKEAINNQTKLIYLESPTSLFFEIQDLEEIAKIAKNHHITTICDNSYSAGIYQNPAKHGIDIVVHSATKYISGHSDTIAGIVCASNEKINKIFVQEYQNLGGIVSPFNAWLLIRGLRTLKIRMNQIAETTQYIIKHLENHPKIEKIIFPLHSSNPQLLIAKKQMNNAGGLFSIVLKTSNLSKIEKFCNNLKYFRLAVSWGGYESLIFPTCLITNQLDKEHHPQNLLRIFIGLEDKDLLLKDLVENLKLT